MASDSAKTQYKPGDKVPRPGIYKVVHDEHRRAHETSFRLNETFPTCRICGDGVRFELVMYAEDGELGKRAGGRQ
jgi:hypothetical protein